MRLAEVASVFKQMLLLPNRVFFHKEIRVATHLWRLLFDCVLEQGLEALDDVALLCDDQLLVFYVFLQ